MLEVRCRARRDVGGYEWLPDEDGLGRLVGRTGDYVHQELVAGAQSQMSDQAETLFERITNLAQDLKAFARSDAYHNQTERLLDFANERGLPLITSTDRSKGRDTMGLIDFYQASQCMREALTHAAARDWHLLIENVRSDARLCARVTYGFTAGIPVPRPYVEADDLVSFAWLEFLQSTVQAHDFKQCPQCGRLFMVGQKPKSKKATRLYCSDRCRVAAYRARSSALGGLGS